MTGRTRTLALTLLVAIAGCPAPHGPGGPRPAAVLHSFADVPITELRAHPAAHIGQVFRERFTFFRVWWSHDRARPHQMATDLPTHFEARIVAAPLYVARIEFPTDDDGLFEPMREGTELCLQVRFLRLHPASASPVFAFERQAPSCVESNGAR
jgi:hypothetical protein